MARLRQLISNHLRYTGSSRAKQILDNWAEYLPKFVKVMPVEYRRALEEMARQQVLELRQLHLHLRFGGARAGGKDVEDQLGAVHYPRADVVLEVLALRG